MSSFNYKTQVRIVVASIAIHNYIKRTSIQDVAFMKFDRHPNFVPDDFLTDVAQHSQSQGHQRPSRIDYIRVGIAASLMTIINYCSNMFRSICKNLLVVMLLLCNCSLVL
jgi:hypothetical protein